MKKCCLHRSWFDRSVFFPHFLFFYIAVAVLHFALSDL